VLHATLSLAEKGTSGNGHRNSGGAGCLWRGNQIQAASDEAAFGRRSGFDIRSKEIYQGGNPPETSLIGL